MPFKMAFVSRQRLRCLAVVPESINSYPNPEAGGIISTAGWMPGVCSSSATAKWSALRGDLDAHAGRRPGDTGRTFHATAMAPPSSASGASKSGRRVAPERQAMWSGWRRARWPATACTGYTRWGCRSTAQRCTKSSSMTGCFCRKRCHDQPVGDEEVPLGEVTLFFSKRS